MLRANSRKAISAVRSESGYMDKGSSVRDMFERIAGRYDIANTVMTGGVDALWRKQAVAALALPADAEVLDLCCGTGALTRELARHAPDGHVRGVDFAESMLDVARSRRSGGNITYERTDVLALPYPDATYDAAAMAFSMRNVTDIGACLRETARVLKPGGLFVNLEVGKPRNPILRRAFYLYFYGVIPFIGGIVGGDRAAYRYLPQSLIHFPDAGQLAALFKQNGFPHVCCTPLMGGVAYLHVGATQASRAVPVPQAYAASSA
jgi:demethylmenaquinone methyltransferase / 2-methoxy-6-polyprenyl-1,4-benzoquinol methylase